MLGGMSNVCFALSNVTCCPRGTRMWRSLPEPADHSVYVGTYAITPVVARLSESNVVRSVSASGLREILGAREELVHRLHHPGVAGLETRGVGDAVAEVGERGRDRRRERVGRGGRHHQSPPSTLNTSRGLPAAIQAVA